MPPKRQQELQITIKSQEHFYELVSSRKLTVVDLHLTWCGACVLLNASFKNIAMKIDDYDNRLQFIVADSALVPDIAHHQQSCKPKFLFYLNGKLIGEVSGVNVPKLQQMINRHIPSLDSDS
jgi:thiol-disulfide isomerase/thioredoxin